jgi:hypothetical protein
MKLVVCVRYLGNDTKRKCDCCKYLFHYLPLSEGAG